MPLPTTNLLARYVGGTGITITGAGVSAWADQSGNGHHATQTTDANRPTTKVVRGRASVSFSGSTYLSLPGTLTVDRQACAIFVCCRQRQGGGPLTLVHFDNNSVDLVLYLASTTGTVKPAVYTNGGARLGSFRAGHGVSTVGVICGASTNMTLVHDGRIETLTGNAAGSFTGGFIGQWNGDTFRFVGEIYEIAIYAAAVDSPTREQVVDYFAATWQATARTSDVFVVYEGDSITEGSTVPPSADRSYPLHVATQARLVAVPKWFNDAAGGNKISGTGGMAEQTQVTAELAGNTASGTRLAVLLGGVNDLNTGATSAAIIAAMDTWIAGRQGEGATVYVCTITPTSDFDGTETTRWNAVNTHIRSTATHNGYIELALDARLSNPANTTYYQGDALHLTEAGHAVVAELVSARLIADGYLTRTPPPGTRRWSY
jgi:lysophospholipase L1-like esterase